MYQKLPKTNSGKTPLQREDAPVHQIHKTLKSSESSSQDGDCACSRHTRQKWNLVNCITSDRRFYYLPSTSREFQHLSQFYDLWRPGVLNAPELCYHGMKVRKLKAFVFFFTESLSRFFKIFWTLCVMFCFNFKLVLFTVVFIMQVLFNSFTAVHTFLVVSKLSETMHP